MEKDLANAMAGLTTGIYVLTVADSGHYHGMSSSWVTQVSGVPPLFSAAVDNQHFSHAIIARTGWRSLGSTLIAYAFAARIPVLIVMYFAMRGGWGTHYDAVEARFAAAPLSTKFFYEAFLPQMMLWIGYTVVVGSLFGEIVAVIFARKPVVQPAS